MRLMLAFAAYAAAASGVRRVLVTGANKGIGLQICKMIVRTEPDVHVLLGSRSAVRGEQAVATVIESEPSAAGRVELVEIDVADNASVESAAEAVAAMFPEEAHPLFAICNNAGVGFGRSITETLETNFYGTKRVCETFLPLLEPSTGRICNIASASGPNFVRGLDQAGKKLFTSRSTTWEALEAELQRNAALTDYEGIACAAPPATRSLDHGKHLTRAEGPTWPPHGSHTRTDGLSKAAVNQWTMQLAAAHPNLKINSCSPGYILTDLTAGMGATKRPEESNWCVSPRQRGHATYDPFKHTPLGAQSTVLVARALLAVTWHLSSCSSAMCLTQRRTRAATTAPTRFAHPSMCIAGRAIRRMWETDSLWRTA